VEDASQRRWERWKTVLGIAWPLVVANSFWNLQLTIDRVFLGTLSTEALAASMAVSGVFWTPMALLQQTAAYLTTFVAQYYGAKRPEMIGASLWQAIYVSVIGGILILSLIPLCGPFFFWVGHAPSLLGLEVDYFAALCYSAMPTALVAVASSFFTGLGSTRVIIGINCVGFICNALLDYLLIFGHFGFPALGIAGAGYATTISNWIAAAYGFSLVFNRANEKNFGVASRWQFNGELMKRYLKFGVPSGMQWALEGLAFTVFLIVVGRMANGPAALAASGIVVTVMMLAILPAMGVAQAASVLVGQHLGEKRPQQAETWTWTGLQIAVTYIVAVGSTFVLFPGFYLSWFHNPSDPALWGQVSTIVPYLLMYVALFTSFDSMNMVFSFALKGAGDTRFVTAVALFMPWPLMVLPTWLVKDWDGAVYWAWGAASFYIIAQAGVFLARFVGGKWKSMSVIN